MQHHHDHHPTQTVITGEAIAARTPKQEQEDASTEVTEVAPGIVRTQLPISMPGLGHVNCYVLEDERGIAVVDPGLPGPESWGHLVDRLGRAGWSVDDVHTVVVTHSHPDHFGGAMRLHHEAGADIVTHDVVPHHVRLRRTGRRRGFRDARRQLRRRSCGGDGAVLRQADAVGWPPFRAAARVPGADPRSRRHHRRGVRDTGTDAAAGGRTADPAGAARLGGDAHARAHVRPPVPLRPRVRRGAHRRPRAARRSPRTSAAWRRTPIRSRCSSRR